MIIKRTTDVNEIKSVLCHDDIYPLISDESCPSPDEWQPPANAIYLGGYTESLIAIGVFHHYRDGVKFHPNVIDKNHANQFIRLCLSPIVVPVYIEIPERLEKLAIYHGFQEISRDEKILMMRSI